MNNPLVINPGVDFNLEELVQRAFEELETSAVEDAMEGLHDADGELPMAGTKNADVSERNFSEGEVETRTRCKVVAN